jgi:hypothetical protein
MNIPLKTNVFAWYLHRVILTKNNIANRNWHGCTKYVFCHKEETIKHLFLNCSVARSIWSVIQIGSTLNPPRSIANIFVNWLNRVDSMFKTLIRVGMIAVVLSLWLCRHEKVFNDKNSSCMQVIYRCTTLLRSWSPLHRLEDCDIFTEVSTRLKNMAKKFISQHGGCIIDGLQPM